LRIEFKCTGAILARFSDLDKPNSSVIKVIAEPDREILPTPFDKARTERKQTGSHEGDNTCQAIKPLSRHPTGGGGRLRGERKKTLTFCLGKGPQKCYSVFSKSVQQVSAFLHNEHRQVQSCDPSPDFAQPLCGHVERSHGISRDDVESG
jgi:hypothetical protein